MILFWIYIIENIDLSGTVCAFCAKLLCIRAAVYFLKYTNILAIKQKIAVCECENYYHTKKEERGILSCPE